MTHLDKKDKIINGLSYTIVLKHRKAMILRAGLATIAILSLVTIGIIDLEKGSHMESLVNPLLKPSFMSLGMMWIFLSGIEVIPTVISTNSATIPLWIKIYRHAVVGVVVFYVVCKYFWLKVDFYADISLLFIIPISQWTSLLADTVGKNDKSTEVIFVYEEKESHE
ncbi:MAG: hypothetical protein EKK64_09835 [Neisseriaceae bacterium]|nr:MAG: hypothetical protein EKK64_09835 [Neisseriaceae bacterium]